MKSIIVVGATGVVGSEVLSSLLAIGVAHSNIFAAASQNSAGSSIGYGEYQIVVQNVADVDFRKYDLAFFTAGASVSQEYVEKAASLGCVVIDNTSYFRMFDDVPLIVPEVNFSDIQKYENQTIIANPNCATIPVVMVLKSLHDVFEAQEVVVSTYQSVSGAGHNGVSELKEQTQNFLSRVDISPSLFRKQIAFNVIPQIDLFCDNRYTKEEEKMTNETRKILGTPDLHVTATCVRVPVFVGHAVSVFVKFKNDIDVNVAHELIQAFPGVKVLEDAKGCLTPLDVVGSEDVLVSRIRKHPTISSGLSFWCVCDNLKKGAATNAIQIARLMMDF